MKWTEEEIKFLLDNCEKLTYKRIGEILGKSKYSINRKVKKIGLVKPNIDKGIYDEKELKTAVAKSVCYSDVLRNLNKNPQAGNYNILKKYIKKFNISISHFIEPQKAGGIKNSELYKQGNRVYKYEKDNIFKENKRISAKMIKSILYNEKIKERKCEMCGQGEIWQNHSLTLQLDHINGNNCDNRIENLRILCPNCHSITDTFCSRNRKNKKNELVKKEESENKKMCTKDRLQRVERPSIKELLAEINELNYSGVARKYGVSDNAIRKWIKSENLNPKDYGFKRGEWAKEKQYLKEKNVSSEGLEPSTAMRLPPD